MKAVQFSEYGDPDVLHVAGHRSLASHERNSDDMDAIAAICSTVFEVSVERPDRRSLPQAQIETKDDFGDLAALR
jgi:hypothetical protein